MYIIGRVTVLCMECIFLYILEVLFYFVCACHTHILLLSKCFCVKDDTCKKFNTFLWFYVNVKYMLQVSVLVSLVDSN